MKRKGKPSTPTRKRPAASATDMVAQGADDVVARVVASDTGDRVASVLATNAGAIVARVEELAAQYDIPLVQDALLTNLLTEVPAGDAIPENVYIAIAEVLSYVYDTVEESDSGK